MVNGLEIFLSNRLELLYQQLKRELFGETEPFKRRIVVVYGPAMKAWLMIRMAQDPDLNIAMGMDILYLNQAFERWVGEGSYPTALELGLRIEKEVREAIEEEGAEWQPLREYFKGGHSRKREKRLATFSQELAKIFQGYGRFGEKLLAKWEERGEEGWQPKLWKRVFTQWRAPVKALQGG